MTDSEEPPADQRDSNCKKLVVTTPKLSVNVLKKVSVKASTIHFKPLLQHVCDSASQIPSSPEKQQSLAKFVDRQ